MGRTIKFRAWHKEDQKMYPVWGILRTLVSLSIGNDAMTMIDATLVELMQFTGLKDRNGKDIYEGDIVKTDGDMKPVPVIFEDGAFQLAGIGYYLNKARVSEWLVEVVGNIYESL